MHLLELMNTKYVISLQGYKNVRINGIQVTVVNLLSQNIREKN